MPPAELHPDDWELFATHFPGAWAWVLHQSRDREYRRLMTTRDRTGGQETRLQELHRYFQGLATLHRTIDTEKTR